MANTLYPAARSAFLRGELDWEGDAATVALCSSTYVYDPAHTTSADLTGVLATAALSGKTVLTDGIADADDVLVSGVTLGQVVSSLVIVSAVGNQLVYFADENDDGTSINLAGDGSDIALVWSAQPQRVFRL